MSKRVVPLLLLGFALAALSIALFASCSGPYRANGRAALYARAQPPAEQAPDMNTESYDRRVDNPFLAALGNPISTFSVDVDTASYANVRRFLDEGQLPPPDAVRIEEMVNYFRYRQPEPEAAHPVGLTADVGPCPWRPEHRLVRIGVKARTLPPQETPPRSLTFLIDVSGSMEDPRKLPLLKRALALLVEGLGARDQVAIVVYAGAEGLALPPTSGADKARILEVLDRLGAGGSTNGGAGIELAYRVATASFVRGGVNRVILATDGDFNVGVSSRGDLVRLVEARREGGVFLTVLGFGMGNLKDSTLEELADKGNGNYAYIDSFPEARKVLVEEVAGTLVTVAKDVKVQVELNPAEVSAYRLVGYENRLLRREQFDDDREDAGDMGSGQTVTALYEIVPARSLRAAAAAPAPLRYLQAPSLAGPAASGELLTVKVRYKTRDGRQSRLLSSAVRDEGRTLPAMSSDFRFAAAVAALGMWLRDTPDRGTAAPGLARDLAVSAGAGTGADAGDQRRGDFLRLVDTAARLGEKGRRTRL
jgi:Ca-activated chloride channel homolog